MSKTFPSWFILVAWKGSCVAMNYLFFLMWRHSELKMTAGYIYIFFPLCDNSSSSLCRSRWVSCFSIGGAILIYLWAGHYFFLSVFIVFMPVLRYFPFLMLWCFSSHRWGLVLRVKPACCEQISDLFWLSICSCTCHHCLFHSQLVAAVCFYSVTSVGFIWDYFAEVLFNQCERIISSGHGNSCWFRKRLR